MVHLSRVLFAVLVLIAPAFGQQPTPVPAPPAAPAPPEGADEPAWSFGASVTTYFVPDDRDYVQPVFTADRDWMHLELRYNYEDLDTVSAWVGYNFSVEGEFTLELTPMLGGVFGLTQGIAPGYKATLGWRQFELYSEGEYLFDADDDYSSFFYSWTELAWSPVETFRFGLVTQHTRVYESERSIQAGLLVGYSGEWWDVTGYLFDPDDEKPTFVLSLGAGF